MVAFAWDPLSSAIATSTGFTASSDCGGGGGVVVEMTGRGLGGGGECGGCLFATTVPTVFASPTHPIAALAGLIRPIITPALSNSLSRNACALLREISMVVVVCVGSLPYRGHDVRRIRLECSDCNGSGGVAAAVVVAG